VCPAARIFIYYAPRACVRSLCGTSNKEQASAFHQTQAPFATKQKAPRKQEGKWQTTNGGLRVAARA
jgi:hypothetical protein